jgi:glycosyltransferase involved in cell wall biosynthesis
MRILHGLVDIAGQSSLSALGLRELGHESHAYAPPHPFGYQPGPDFGPRAAGRVLGLMERALWLSRNVRNYDVFHFHAAGSFLPASLHNADVRLIRHGGRRVVVEFWGSEVRMPSVERGRNPYYTNAYGEDDAASAERLARWAELTDGHVIIADHSLDPVLSRYFDTIHVVGQRVAYHRIPQAFPDPNAAEPVLMHAPSQHAAKGTVHVRRAVEQLKARGVRFRYVEVSGRTHADVMEESRRSDLVVDQLCLGSHGVFAAEAMAMGKPVVCYLMPEVRSTYPADLPLIDATPEDLPQVLEYWLTSGQARHAQGKLSRAYAARMHDCRRVAERLLTAYHCLPS